MFLKLSRIFPIAALTFAAFTNFHAGVFGQDDDEGDSQKRRVIVIEQDEDVDESNGEKDRRIIIRQRELPKYWIGVACSINDQGVSIGEVLKDSPAEKAELKAGDIILSVGDRKVTELSDLVDAVQESDGKEIKLEIQRGDETTTVAVTPEKRSREFGPSRLNLNDLNLSEDWSQIMPQLRGWLDGDPDDFDISMIHPGIVIGDEELPAGVSISIRRENDDPAKLTIKRDGETWEVTEESIDELPKDLRGPARKMLAAAGGRSILRRPDVKRFEQFLPGGRDIRIERRRQQNADSNSELKAELKEMREEIRELRELLKELKSDN